MPRIAGTRDYDEQSLPARKLPNRGQTGRVSAPGSLLLLARDSVSVSYTRLDSALERGA